MGGHSGRGQPCRVKAHTASELMSFFFYKRHILQERSDAQITAGGRSQGPAIHQPHCSGCRRREAPLLLDSRLFTMPACHLDSPPALLPFCFFVVYFSTCTFFLCPPPPRPPALPFFFFMLRSCGVTFDINLAAFRAARGFSAPRCQYKCNTLSNNCG